MKKLNALTEAYQIIENAQSKTANGPDVYWQKLKRIKKYVDDQVTEAFKMIDQPEVD